MHNPSDALLYPYEKSADQTRPKPVRHGVVIVGAGPVGLVAALDLAQKGIQVLVLDDNDRVSTGSRAIAYAKRTLDILDRLGCADETVAKGVRWHRGKVFFRDDLIYEFDLQPEDGERHPAFVNLQQYHLESILIDRLRALQALGFPVELRGRNKVVDVSQHSDCVTVTVDTPDGPYRVQADWLMACDGAKSSVRSLLGLDFLGRSFEDNFLIADIAMTSDFPTERWFWFDPPFNRGQSALLHRQPDNIWRIDLQLGRDIDKDAERKPENVIPRLRAMLGNEVSFKLDWVSIYNFRCCRMEKFRHGRIFFAGDAAHLVSPFGGRGANSGIQDVDNLCWKLALVLKGQAAEALLDSYNAERIPAADENIGYSTRATDFITPKSPVSRMQRDAVLDLARDHGFARPMVNSGRLSTPTIYKDSPLSSFDMLSDAPTTTAPGNPSRDAPLSDGFLLNCLGGAFRLLGLNTPVPAELLVDGIQCVGLEANTQDTRHVALADRYLGNEKSAVYLVRPDQVIAARFATYDPDLVRSALQRAVKPRCCYA